MAHGKAEELTGRRRCTPVLVGKGYDAEAVVLKLQVEVSYWNYSKRKWSVKWRDATPADLPEELLNGYGRKRNVGC